MPSEDVDALIALLEKAVEKARGIGERQCYAFRIKRAIVAMESTVLPALSIPKESK